jgi:uncharacterized protein YbjT (DUF2867 family)
MKIVVIGGSGLIGSKLVTKLDEHGHETVAASPDTGVDTLTGEGLAAALAGASVVVDVSNAPSLEDTSIRNLLAAEAAAGVGHHVALSAVGIQQMLIEGSSIPFSIVRATNIAGEDVAGVLAGICVGPPLNGIVQLSPHS